MLWKETRALFRCRCRASLIGCAAFLLYSRPLINQCWQGRGFVCHIAGTNVCQGVGHTWKEEAAHATQPHACRLAPARFDGLAWRKNCLIIDMKMFWGGWEGEEDGVPDWCVTEGYAHVCVCVCAVVAIIYLAYPSLTCPPTALSSLSEKRVVQRKDEDTGRRQSEPGLSPGETHSAALHEILFIIILTGLNVGR